MNKDDMIECARKAIQLVIEVRPDGTLYCQWIHYIGFHRTLYRLGHNVLSFKENH